MFNIFFVFSFELNEKKRKKEERPDNKVQENDL